MAFSPDGTCLVSGSYDQTVRLWDTVPYRIRYQERQAILAARPEAERIVDELWKQLNDWESVATLVRENASLSEPVRRAALNVVLRSAQPQRMIKLLEVYRQAAELPGASPQATNKYALTLLTCEPEELRDPQAALPVANRSVEMSGETNAEHLDTLALAYFMTGDTAKAIETQEKAIALLSAGKSPLRTELEANLAKFRAAAKNESPE